jgi:Tol biopolymer transport system component
MTRSTVLCDLKQASVVTVVLVAALAAVSCGSGSSGSSTPKAAQLGVALYWAAGGKLIVFSGRDRPSHLWVMHSDGSHRRKVTRPRPELVYDESVSPSARMVAYLTGIYNGERGHLVLRTLAGTPLQSFRLPPLGYDGYDGYVQTPVWAPTGDGVALDSSDGIFLADTRNGRLRLISSGTTPVWSPDGGRISFVGESGGLSVMRRDGTHVTAVARRVSGSTIAWSPDGRRLAFLDKGGIYVVRPDGSGRHRIANGLPLQIAWSPDSQHLACLGSWGIFVASLRGGRPLLVTTKKGQDNISWAPSERILYSRRAIIYTVLPGSQPVPIG